MSEMVTVERVGRRLGERFWSPVPAGSPLALERSAIELGDPWMVIHIAGLRYYEYGHDDGLGRVVSPSSGDRLSLIRRPENRHDGNAVEIWWRNGIHLGHVPRHHAEWLAPELDAGKSIRAFVVRPLPCSMEAMMMGTAVETRGERSPPPR